MDSIEDIRNQAFDELNAAGDAAAVRELSIRYLGRKGLVTRLLRSVSGLPPDQRAAFGKQANALKGILEETFEKALKRFATPGDRQEKAEIDISLPGRVPPVGALHPITQIMGEICEIFLKMGFDIAEGPEVESDYYNFEALNIPKDHPARDMQDTFYVSDSIVLRTHTSPVQIRTMEKQPPPVRVIAPGKVFRCDSDLTHTPMFHQVEGLFVDEGVSFGDLKGTLTAFVHQMFDEETGLAVSPQLFPFHRAERRGGYRVRDVPGVWLPGLLSHRLAGDPRVGHGSPGVVRESGVRPRSIYGVRLWNGCGADRHAEIRHRRYPQIFRKRYAVFEAVLAMKASLSWLKAYVPIDRSVSELAEALTMAGLEVESVNDRFDFMKSVLVAKVIQIRPHPNADKLRLCDVDAGGRTLKVVCGAPNVKKGMLSAVALPGTRFPNGTILRESVIRGEVSEGMLCSEKELGLGDDASGILTLDPSLSPGSTLAEARGLSDPVLEIAVTPNRPDCLSILGVAREIAAIQQSELVYPDVQFQEGEDRTETLTSVQIQAPEHCPRYAARLVFDVTVGPSPFWLRDRLSSVGLRPINNIVDVTNFVLMELGQPLHAFDFDRLSGHRIVVKTAEKGNRFTTLDQKERTLSADTLMICDGEKGVAIGGVMGGMNSEISETTTRVLIESAYFDPIRIRRTAKRLGISTEASHRFERGVDPEGVLPALNRTAQLMAETARGRILDGWVDVYPNPVPKREVTVSLTRANRLLGTGFTQEEFRTVLESVEFSATPLDKDRLRVIVPSYRVDVSRPEDLMEEAARLSGYPRIPVTFPSIRAPKRRRNPSFRMRAQIRRWMAGFGFLEAINYSFISSRFDERLGLPEDDFRRKTVQVLNPISDDQSRMRTTLIPGILGSLQRNLSQQIRSLRLFETGKVYLQEKRQVLPQETEMLALLWTGFRFDPGWYGKETPCDFFDIKGAVEGLLRALGLRAAETSPLPEGLCPYMKPGRSAVIRAADCDLGWMGEVRSEVLIAHEIQQTVFVAELNLDALLPLLPQVKKVGPLSRFPMVTRDFTLIVDKQVRTGDIFKCVASAGEEWIESVHLFDVFESDPIPAGKKSISFRITYRSQERTLEDQEVTQVHQKISGLLLKTFDASLPE